MNSQTVVTGNDDETRYSKLANYFGALWSAILSAIITALQNKM